MADVTSFEGKEWTVGEQVFDAQGVPATIAYVGEAQFATGKWIGLVFEQPVGKNNGTVKDVKYFECEQNHGRFVRENQITSLSGERRGSSATSLSGSTTSLHSLADLTAPSRAADAGTSSKLARPGASGMKPPSAIPPSVKSNTSRLSMPAPGQTKTGGITRPSVGPAQIKPILGSVTESKAPSVKKQSTEPSLPAVNTGKDNETIPVSELFSSVGQPKRVLPAAVESSKKPVEVVEISQSMNQVERRQSIQSEGEAAPSAPVALRIQESAEQVKLRRDQEIEISKLRLQVEQLELNKLGMTEVHSRLQKELDSARRETREALDAANSDEVADLQHDLEMLAIEKEMADEKRDQLAAELEDLKLKLEETTVELESLQHEVKEGGQGEASSNFRVLELQKQNEKLRDGLIKLRDISGQEKQDKQKLEKEIKILESANEELKKTVDKLQTEAARTDEVLADLREQVDAALGSEEMVERLTSQNLDMEDKIRELREAVDDYESMASMNNEVIELGSQSARQLREDLDMARAESSSLKHKISDLQQIITDSTVTLHKFRDLTRQLQTENSSLREQLQLQASASSSQLAPVAPLTIDFRLRVQDEKAIADRVNGRMLDISGKMLAKKLGYLSLFMPDIYSVNREEAFVQICVIPEQIGLKLTLISDEVLQKFEIPSVVNSAPFESLSAKRRDEITYGLSFTCLLKVIEIWDRDIDHAIRCATPDAFAVLNELESQLQRQDDSIQYYVDLLKQSRLDEMTSLEYLDTSAGHLSSMISRLFALGCDQRSRMEKLRDVMDVFTAAARVVGAVSCGLKIGLRDHGPEVTKWLTDFIQRSEDITEIARKIRRPLDTDNELRAVMLPDHVQSQLRPLVESVQRVASLCFTWYKAVGHQASVQAAEKGAMDGKAVKDILYSVNDQGHFYKSTAASPQQSMLNALDESVGMLRQFSKEIDDGEWTRGALKAPETPKLHPLRLRADLLKKSLADAEDLKSKILAKDEEIHEIRKNLRVKVEEVSELQLRRSMTEQKLVKAGKTEEANNSKLLTANLDLTARLSKLQDAYESESTHLRSQVELLESEKRQMEEKLKQTSKRFLSVDMSPGKTTGKTGAGDQNVEGQVEVLRQVIATLRADVVAVKSEQVRRDLEEKLPPLRVPTTAKRDVIAERIGKLQRDKTTLEMQRVVMFGRTALDLTKPREEREKLMKERKTHEAEFQLKMRKIQTEISELLGPGRYFLQETAAPGS